MKSVVVVVAESENTHELIKLMEKIRGLEGVVSAKTLERVVQDGLPESAPTE